MNYEPYTPVGGLTKEACVLSLAAHPLKLGQIKPTRVYKHSKRQFAFCPLQGSGQGGGEPTHDTLRLSTRAHLRVSLRHGSSHVLQVIPTDHDSSRAWSR